MASKIATTAAKFFTEIATWRVGRHPWRERRGERGEGGREERVKRSSRLEGSQKGGAGGGEKRGWEEWVR